MKKSTSKKAVVAEAKKPVKTKKKKAKKAYA